MGAQAVNGCLFCTSIGLQTTDKALADQLAASSGKQRFCIRGKIKPVSSRVGGTSFASSSCRTAHNLTPACASRSPFMCSCFGSHRAGTKANNPSNPVSYAGHGGRACADG